MNQHAKYHTTDTCVFCLNKCVESLEEQLSAANATIATAREAISEVCPQYVSTEKMKAFLSNTQAAADAYMAEEKAKVLEEAASSIELYECNEEMERKLRAMAATIRASANKITKG